MIQGAEGLRNRVGGAFAALARGLLPTICGLLVVEMGLRLYDGVQLLDFENFVAAKADYVNADSLRQYDKAVGWAMKPNLKGTGNVLYTGKYGVRMNQDEITDLPTGGILVSGDSFAAGADVTNSETWPAHLERRIGRAVLNAGSGGYALDQIELRAEELTPVLKPSAIILSFESAALLKNQYRVLAGGGKPYFTIEGGALVLHNQPVKRLENNPAPIGFWRSVLGYSHLANTLITGAGFGREWWDSNIYVETGVDSVRVACLLLDRMKHFAAAKRIPFLAVLQYNGASLTAYKDEPEFAVQVVRCSQQSGIGFVDTWQPLKEVLDRDGVEALKRLHVMLDGGRAYGHLSGAGNEFVARLVAERLQNGEGEANSP
jgi:hypothetical protein